MRETKQVKEEMIVGIGEFYAWSEIDMQIDQEAEQSQIDWREKNEWQVGEILLEEHSKEQVHDK